MPLKIRIIESVRLGDLLQKPCQRLGGFESQAVDVRAGWGNKGVAVVGPAHNHRDQLVGKRDRVHVPGHVIHTQVALEGQIKLVLLQLFLAAAVLQKTVLMAAISIYIEV